MPCFRRRRFYRHYIDKDLMAIIDDLNSAVSAVVEKLQADATEITTLKATVASAPDPAAVQAAIAALNAAVAVPTP